MSSDSKYTKLGPPEPDRDVECECSLDLSPGLGFELQIPPTYIEFENPPAYSKLKNVSKNLEVMASNISPALERLRNTVDLLLNSVEGSNTVDLESGQPDQTEEVQSPEPRQVGPDDPENFVMAFAGYVLSINKTYRLTRFWVGLILLGLWLYIFCGQSDIIGNIAVLVEKIFEGVARVNEASRTPP